MLDSFVDEAEVPVELVAAEAVDGDDRAVLDELPRGGLLDLLLQTDCAVRLHGALVDEGGPRVDGCAAVALEDERGHAVMAEEHRGRQPDQTAADDQDRDLFVGHLRLHRSLAEDPRRRAEPVRGRDPGTPGRAASLRPIVLIVALQPADAAADARSSGAVRVARTPRTARSRPARRARRARPRPRPAAPVRIRFTGTSSFFPVSVRGIAGTATTVSGACRGESAVRSAPLMRASSAVVELEARAEHDEQEQLVLLLEVDDEAVEHLVELLDDRVDLARPEPDAAAVERRVRAAGDHRAPALGEQDPVAEAPDARVVVEVRLAVARAVGVVPEGDGHRRHRLLDHELAELADDGRCRPDRTRPRRRPSMRVDISPA